MHGKTLAAGRGALGDYWPRPGGDGYHLGEDARAINAIFSVAKPEPGAIAFYEEVPVRAGAFLGLATLLMMVWVVSFLVYHIAGLLIHVFLLLAVIFLVLQLVSGRKV